MVAFTKMLEPRVQRSSLDIGIYAEPTVLWGTDHVTDGKHYPLFSVLVENVLQSYPYTS